MERIVLTPPEELQRLIEKATERAVLRVVREAVRQAARPPYLTVEDLSRITGWSDRRIRYLVKKRRLPHIRHGRKILFKTSEIERILEQARIPAQWRWWEEDR